MRGILKWLLLLGVFAGLQGRAFAVSPCGMHAALHGHEHVGHDHEADEPDGHPHDQECPLEHHHHGHTCLCHGMPLADASEQPIRLSVPWRNLSRPRHSRETIPDEPLLSEEKPPLI